MCANWPASRSTSVLGGADWSTKASWKSFPRSIDGQADAVLVVSGLDQVVDDLRHPRVFSRDGGLATALTA
jgi:hypothetical protein